MRKLILQPPRTCNCFHLVLAKFCIFDTCNFAFPSGDWQREIGCAEAKVWTCHFQCPDNYWPNAKKAVPLHSQSSEMASLTKVSSRVRDCSAPSLALALLFSSKLQFVVEDTSPPLRATTPMPLKSALRGRVA